MSEPAALRPDAFCLVMTTLPDEAAALALARSLVEARQAACVQLMPVRSVYRWQADVCEEPECLLLIKTRAELFAALTLSIRQQHPYVVPEIIQLPVTAGSAAYLGWLAAQTEPGA